MFPLSEGLEMNQTCTSLSGIIYSRDKLYVQLFAWIEDHQVKNADKGNHGHCLESCQTFMHAVYWNSEITLWSLDPAQGPHANPSARTRTAALVVINTMGTPNLTCAVSLQGLWIIHCRLGSSWRFTLGKEIFSLTSSNVPAWHMVLFESSPAI